MSQNLSSAAVVIGALRVKIRSFAHLQKVPIQSNLVNSKSSGVWFCLELSIVRNIVR